MSTKSLKDLRIGSEFPTFIIAEIGINHEGDVKLCADMIHAAKEAGADAIKLQTIDADANYVEGTESYHLFKKSALSREETADMFALARSLSVLPFTTCGDLQTLRWLEELEPVLYKISSGLLTHIPFIRQLVELRKPLLMSTGMANTQDIKDAMSATQSLVFSNKLALFQCTSLYPVPLNQLQLASIRFMNEKYQVPVGFSDHSIGIDAAPLAVAAGACLLEKHFTLDVSKTDYDHPLSLEPEKFSVMVRKIREVENMMGSFEKSLPDDLKYNKQRYDRCLVARKEIALHDVLTEENISVKRPLPDRRGLAPKFYEKIIGKPLKKALKKDDPICSDCVDVNK